uniref:NR LBD domain-containing protein n=1 Tax=Caenorhabditis tropicalis TaxID=1561998 RepID=A0A1I7TLS2_9PELO
MDAQQNQNNQPPAAPVNIILTPVELQTALAVHNIHISVLSAALILHLRNEQRLMMQGDLMIDADWNKENEPPFDE